MKKRSFRRSSLELSLVTAVVAAALLPAIAGATPILPDPRFSGALQTLHTDMQLNEQGTYVLGGASTTISGFPSLTGHAVMGTGVEDIASLESMIDYSFAVDGPVGGPSTVPLVIDVTLHASASGPGTDRATARFVLSVGSYQPINIFYEASNTGLTENGFSGTIPFSANLGGVYNVHLQIDAAALFGGVADVIADSVIFIDPDFLLSNPGYSVLVSRGISNTAVPEPSTMLLLGSGLVGLVGYGRRRFKK